jgi:diacylglycerol O-acyltransferase / trehalose O-mycolyltransferase
VTATLAVSLASGPTPGLAAPTTIAPASPGCAPRSTPPVAGTLRLVSERPIDRRVTDLTVYSPAMGQSEHVNVLLPLGYDPNGSIRYPVLYLLHGALGGYMNWYTDGTVERLVGRRPLVVVMPDGGYDGSYSDWYGLLDGQNGPVPAWETFHVGELIPYIDSHYLVRADRGHRFIAGLSAGGGGATHYAADNPGLFGAVGSFSGANDNLEQYPIYPTLSEGLWLATDAPGDGPDGHCTWGDPYTQRVVWQDNNPTYLASNLRGTRLWLASGNGLPGPLDPALGPDPTNPGQELANAGGVVADGLTEAEIWDMTKSFVRALNAAGIPHTDYFYGPGTHSWPYWRRDLTRFLAWLSPQVGRPESRPPEFSFRTADQGFAAWGWRFQITGRDVREFVYLSHVGHSGLDALGSGRLIVRTPGLYQPGAAYDVNGRVVRADLRGRLRFVVSLGPSHHIQQYRFASGARAGWRRTTVRIDRVGQP